MASTHAVVSAGARYSLRLVLPVGRFGTPEEVSEIVVAVASNAFITGQTIQVNGGIYMT